MDSERMWRGGSLRPEALVRVIAERPLFDYAIIRPGQSVRITTPTYTYVACVRKVHRKGDKPDEAVTGFLVHGSDFDAHGQCSLTPWVSATPVIWETR